MKNKNKKIYLIGNAHLDPVWLWQWQDGFSETKATFQSALDRMNEFDDFIFVCAGAGSYKWVEDNCPEMFEEIKERIEQGRWKIVGGWWVQPDCNLPDGESFVRHSLYSQGYFKEKFGIIAETGYNVDSFGHDYMIPQILKKSGMNNYIYMRPDNSETDIEIPDPLFWWESPDGSRVLTYRILDAHYQNNYSVLEDVINNAYTRQDLNTDDFMLFYGVGNHGGGPTISALNLIHDMQKEIGEDELFISDPDTYFQDMRDKDIDFKVYKNDLQHHASGCYANHFEFKKLHRSTEQLLLATERWSSIAQLSMGLKYEDKELKSAWETLLFNQFHDIMGGCSIQDALIDAEHALGYVKHTASGVLNNSLQKISWAIDTSKEGAIRSKEKSGQLWEYKDFGAPLVVFNPLAFSINVLIFLDYNPEFITDSDSNVIKTQNVKGRNSIRFNSHGTIFMAQLPALGYNTYWLHLYDEEPKGELKLDLPVRYKLENEYMSMTIDKETGFISSLYNKINSIEHIKDTAAKPIIIDGIKIDTWGHRPQIFNDIIGEFKMDKMELVEDGDIRSTIRVTYTYNKSQLTQEFSLYADSKDIDVKLKVNWQEHNKMLKLAFDIDADSPKAIYSSAYGHIQKECNAKEEPGHMWMDLSGDKSGVALACQARYSYSCEGNSMRLNVIRSPIFADHCAAGALDDYERMDQGIHKLEYKLIPHSGDWHGSNVIQKALELNNPPQKIHETYHTGVLPLKSENVIMSNPNIIMIVFKPCENKNIDSYIIRMYETIGKNSKTMLEIPLLNVNAELDFSAFEIKTLTVKKDGSVKDVNLLEQ